ncbi:hypothetical protein MKX01_028940 [Papaver californicum]|nr:hypothetical protein MKX01_028940 [Papaver californicum]
MATPVKQNDLPIKEYDSAIFYSGSAKGLVEGCLLTRDREAYSHITDQAKMLGICFQNTLCLLASIDCAHQMQKSTTTGRDRVIRDAVANMDHEIARLRSE